MRCTLKRKKIATFHLFLCAIKHRFFKINKIYKCLQINSFSFSYDKQNNKRFSNRN